MAGTVRVGPLDLTVSVYTTDATCYAAGLWRSCEAGYDCAALVSGEAGEQVAARGAAVSLEVLASDAGRACFRMHCRHCEPVKAIKASFELPVMKMLAPECIELPEGEWRQWDFPAFWRTGFAVWQHGARFLVVATRDFPWHFKRIRALRAGQRLRLEIVQDAGLRERSFRLSSSTWEIGFLDRIDDFLDDYATFVRQAYGALDFERRPDVPSWLRRVGLVVNLHGTDWNGQTNLDFAAMTRAAERLAELFPPERTILYPIGWDGRYMRGYPEFRPSEGLGGVAGFRDFCSRARELGFHVMPHLNAMACNARHRWYVGHLQNYVMRNWLGNPVHCQHIDWDRDGLGDPAHSYVSLVPPALRDVLVAAVGRLVEDYGIDAVFLDETCNVFYNDPAWDQVEGVRRLVRELRRLHPGLLIAGEEWNEMLLGLIPLVQIWEETADDRKAFGREKSPLMRAWAGRFIRSCGYLATASPDGHTGVHEWPDRPWVDQRANEAYYIPTLALTRDSLERGWAGVSAGVARAQDYIERFAEG